MKKLLIALGLLFCAQPAFAESLVVAVCGTLPLAYTAGATRYDTVDVNGVKCSNASGGGGSSTVTANVYQWGGGILGAMANYGTSPGAVLVPGVNAFITNTATVNAIVSGGSLSGSVSSNVFQLNGVALGSPSNYGTSPGAVAVQGVNAFVTNTATVNATVVGTVNVSVTNTATVNTVGEGALGATAGCTSASSSTLVQCAYQLHSDVTSAIPAGTNTIGGVNLAATTTGGCTPGKLLTAASTNSTLIATGAHTLCKIVAVNVNTALAYLKFYDKATAPTCNSDTVIATYAIPFGASNAGGGVAVPIGPFGEAYASGIGFCVTANILDNDNTATATGITISYSYK